MKRKRCDMEFKKRVAREALHTGNVSEVARKHGLVPSTLRGWVSQYKIKQDLWEKTEDRAKKVSSDGQDGHPSETVLELRERVRQLEEEIGKCRKQKREDQLEIDILKDLIKKRDLCPRDRIEVAEYWMEKGFSQNRTLGIVGVSKSVYRNHRENKGAAPQGRKVISIHHSKGKMNIPGYALDKKGEKISDGKVMDIVRTSMEENRFMTYGYRKLSHYLKEEKDIIVNHKKMYRLCGEAGLLRYRGKRRRSSLPAHRAYERTITASNQLWEMDIQHVRLLSGPLVQILSIIDVFDRVIVSSGCYLSCKSGDVIKAVQGALRQYAEGEKEPPVIRTDNGPQFTSHPFHEFIESKGIHHELIPVQSPNHNAHVESFHSIARRDFFERFEFPNFRELCKEHTAFINYYNGECYHGSLGNLTPLGYRELMKQPRNQDVARVVKVI